MRRFYITLILRILRILPRPIRFEIIKRRRKIDYQALEGLEIRLAQTQQELAECYRILQESYEQMGFAKKNEAGMRIVKYFALPTTSTFCALLNGKVIATCSIIRQSPMGLPIEAAFDIQKLKNSGQVAEISSLAIDKNYRHRGGRIYLRICKFVQLYCQDYLKLDYAVCVVNPAMADVYRGLFFYQDLQKKVVDKYDFANGAPAVGLFSEVQKYRDDCFRAYSRRDINYNLYHFFYQFNDPTLKFPKREYETSMDPIMTPTMLKYFFTEKSNVFEKLSTRDVFALWSFYNQEEYWSVLPKKELYHKGRTESRFVASPKAYTNLDGHIQLINIYDVSKGGMLVKGVLPIGVQRFEINCIFPDHETATLEVEVRWSHPDSQLYGVKIVNDRGLTWDLYIQKFYQSLTHLAQAQ